ncbi:MAG: hypothetical protein KF767_08945 [Bdellovibrionaceae bacterium]|nr:hypothetical protein [Pseudobdellovibrionaceae bacterium]
MSRRQSTIYITRVSTPKGCGPYRYLVTQDSTSWCAFRTRRGVRQFIRDLNLTVKLMRRTGRGLDSFAVYECHSPVFEQLGSWDLEKFMRMEADVERVSHSNGDLTLWKIMHLDGGGCVMYHMNPNVKDRPTYPREAYSDSGPDDTSPKRKG